MTKRRQVKHDLFFSGFCVYIINFLHLNGINASSIFVKRRQ